MFKIFIQKKLEKYVRNYFKNHQDMKLVVVSGSVGKTSTKTAIATVLSQKFRVRMEEGNHNTEMSAPLGILGIEYPEKVHSVNAWIAVFRAAKERVDQPSDVDVIVQELGTDGIGQIAHFGTYLTPDIGVVTGVTPEHMEFFGSIEKVAEEELAAANFSNRAFINRDDIDDRFAAYLTNANVDTYGTTESAEYRFEINNFSLDSGYEGTLKMLDSTTKVSSVKVVGEHSLRPVVVSAAVGQKLGMTNDEIARALAQIRPVKGRMNILRGLEGSTIIDDTYNSSPAAASAAMQTLYELQTPQRIAILGDMRELGESSQAEHEKLGELCDPNLLSWVVTVGPESEQWLAPKARERGCQVKSFRSSVEAGTFVHSVMEENAIILAKGSQNTIFVEEAIKMFLHATEEEKQLVRQSPYWLKVKSDFFASLT